MQLESAVSASDAEAAGLETRVNELQSEVCDLRAALEEQLLQRDASDKLVASLDVELASARAEVAARQQAAEQAELALQQSVLRVAQLEEQVGELQTEIEDAKVRGNKWSSGFPAEIHSHSHTCICSSPFPDTLERLSPSFHFAAHARLPSL